MIKEVWVQQLIILVVGAAFLWWLRSQRLRMTDGELRHDNWTTVPIVGIAIASVILWLDEKSGIKPSHVLWGVVALVAYTGFVYKWNQGDPHE